MPDVKYYDAINAAQSSDAAKPKAVLPAFNLDAIAASGISAKIKAKLFEKLIGPAYAISRAFFPVMRIGGFYHVTRDEQVRKSCGNPRYSLCHLDRR